MTVLPDPSQLFRQVSGHETSDPPLPLGMSCNCRLLIRGQLGKQGTRNGTETGTGNGNGKQEREMGTGNGNGKREETTAPRSLFANSSRDDSVMALTAILFTN